MSSLRRPTDTLPVQPAVVPPWAAYFILRELEDRGLDRKLSTKAAGFEANPAMAPLGAQLRLGLQWLSRDGAPSVGCLSEARKRSGRKRESFAYGWKSVV